MPLYTYRCRDHGEFAHWASMAESEMPRDCPTCATAAPRALAKPRLAGTNERGDDAAIEAAADAESSGADMASGGCCGGGACMH